MRILIGMPDKDSWGGPAASEPPFVKELRQCGIDVVVETYVYGDNQGATNVFSRALRVIRTAVRLRQRLAESEFDILHLNTAFDKKTVVRDAISVFLMRPKTAKVFLKIHGAAAHLIPPKSQVYRRLIRYLDKRVTGFGVFTRDEIESFRPHDLDPQKFHLIKNIVVLDDGVGEETRPIASNANFDLLFVSRFIPTKGLLETITALSLLRDSGGRFRLHCVGDGPIRFEAERLTKKLDLDTVVTFTGYIPETEVTKHFRTADIFVFPTRHTEGFPIALFKAIKAGMPIVTTKVRAAAEYLKEPDNCLFCSNDPIDIARQIEELASNEAIRQRMSAENLKLGQTLNADAVTAEYIEVYRKLLGERAS